MRLPMHANSHRRHSACRNSSALRLWHWSSRGELRASRQRRGNHRACLPRRRFRKTAAYLAGAARTATRITGRDRSHRENSGENRASLLPRALLRARLCARRGMSRATMDTDHVRRACRRRSRRLSLSPNGFRGRLADGAGRRRRDHSPVPALAIAGAPIRDSTARSPTDRMSSHPSRARIRPQRCCRNASANHALHWGHPS